MAHKQENPQNAGKDTRMPAAGETRQMPLRADRPAQTAQAPYSLQGRPAPTQRVAVPFAAPGRGGVPGASAVPGAHGAPGGNGAFAAGGANVASSASAVNAANGVPGANAALGVNGVAFAEAAETEKAPERKGLGGLLEGLSVPQVAAGALAAVTSMLLSSKIGIAGSVIGVAVGSVVSTVAS